MREMGVAITEGTFRIYTIPRGLKLRPPSMLSYIEHKCPTADAAVNSLDPRWVVFCNNTETCDTSCWMCNEAPPDGIQAMFWFLWEDPQR